jgi:hypothetical protein
LFARALSTRRSSQQSSGQANRDRNDGEAIPNAPPSFPQGALSSIQHFGPQRGRVLL